MTNPDLLYSIFEQHLLSAIVEEETTDEFLARVVGDYMSRLSTKAVVLREHVDMIEADLREEVLEMVRKKTYGYYNLNAFREAHTSVPKTRNNKKSQRES